MGMEIPRGETAVEIFASPEILVREETRSLVERIAALEKVVASLQDQLTVLVKQQE